MPPRFPRLTLALLISGVVLIGIYASMVLSLRSRLRAEIRQTIIDRDAAVLRPVALRQLAQHPASPAQSDQLLAAVLESAQQENMLAIALFDDQAEPIRQVPDSLLFAELPLDDYLRLLKRESISRYHAAFPLDRYFDGATASSTAPVLEVLLPLHGPDPASLLGFAQYYIDARALSAELATTDRRIQRVTLTTLVVGAVLIGAVLALTHVALRRAQRVIAERNAQLVRTNFELTLAAKTSALGQITSHLIHGLQGPVAGLRAMMAARTTDTAASPDWATAADYTARMQSMIEEAVRLLADTTGQASYQLSGHELAAIVRERHTPPAARRGLRLEVTGDLASELDNHRGGILCLVINNLVENALAVAPAGSVVVVQFAEAAGALRITVADAGPGIPTELRDRLFEPGRSLRPGGTGLGLAISQLLARQIGATLALESTGPHGTAFSLTLPFAAT